MAAKKKPAKKSTKAKKAAPRAVKKRTAPVKKAGRRDEEE